MTKLRSSVLVACLLATVGSAEASGARSLPGMLGWLVNASDEREDTTIYKAVVNDEGQYSIWPADRDFLPLGWRDGGKTGTKPEVLAYIEEIWTDKRPRSLRHTMAGEGLERPSTNPPVVQAPPPLKNPVASESVPTPTGEPQTPGAEEPPATDDPPAIEEPAAEEEETERALDEEPSSDEDAASAEDQGVGEEERTEDESGDE